MWRAKWEMDIADALGVVNKMVDPEFAIRHPELGKNTGLW